MIKATVILIIIFCFLSGIFQIVIKHRKTELKRKIDFMFGGKK
jgi:hypothetical protein